MSTVTQSEASESACSDEITDEMLELAHALDAMVKTLETNRHDSNTTCESAGVMYAAELLLKRTSDFLCEVHGVIFS